MDSKKIRCDRCGTQAVTQVEDHGKLIGVCGACGSKRVTNLAEHKTPLGV